MIQPDDSRTVRALVFFLLFAGGAASALGLEHVTLQREGETIRIEGRLVETAQDGGLLVEGRDGVLWLVPPDELVEHTTDEAAFEPLDAKALADRVLGELPKGFKVHTTANYVILYNTSQPYALWCGSLFERLYKAFNGYWTNKGLELAEPDFPLVAIVFSDKRSFAEFSRPEVGDGVEAIIGYYSLRTNRMVMYDMAGTGPFADFGAGRRTSSRISDFLRRSDAPQTVATIVHEATHQIAHNCGLHTRFSDCPMWLSEGIALYFETPDLRSRRGWSGIGDPNPPRLKRFREYSSRRPTDSLEALISDDERLKSTKTGQNAYAEAWALTYFLIKRHPDEYVEYLRRVSEKRPLLWDDAETRLREFREVFGDDLQKLDAEMLRTLNRLR